MNLINILKGILYVALALLALVLWNLWQRESANEIKTNSSLSNTNLPAFPLEKKDPSISVNDSATVPSLAVSGTSSTAKATEYIIVKTDTLSVKIDKKGGNIIQNDLLNYAKTVKDPSPLNLLTEDPAQLYITQSGITGNEGPDTQQGQITYETEKNEYSLASNQNELHVDFLWKNKMGHRLVKTYTFYRGSYKIDLDYKIYNEGDKNWSVYPYVQLQRKEPPKQSALFHYGLFVGAAVSSPDNHYEKFSFKDLKKSQLSKTVDQGWIAMVQHYFLSAWIPSGGEYHYYSNYLENDIYTLGMISRGLSVAPQHMAEVNFKFYSGPAVADDLNKVAPYLNLTIDYGWLWFISAALFWIMKYIEHFLGNWGWSIIILTLFIKLVFYQLSAKSYRAMARMRQLQPRMQQLKERYAEDKQKLSQAMMELYQKEKVNPLSGCLPILIQIPFFISLYYMIIESVELRHAPFILWIHDLSTADPYYILPVIMGGIMFLQQKLNPPAPDPVQQKVMMFLPVIFTIFFLTFPAGLVLYWITNTALGALQQWWMTRKVDQNL